MSTALNFINLSFKPIFKISEIFSKMQIFKIAKSTILKILKDKLFFQFTASYR